MVMQFLKLEDFRALVTDRDREVLAPQTDILAASERFALEEVRSYIGCRYDLDRAFAAVDEHRNSQLVMIVVDITLYHLCANLPQRMSLENRETRYNRTISFLKDVQSGKASPNLPALLDDEGVDRGGGVLYGGWAKCNYEY